MGGYVGEIRGWYHRYTVTKLSPLVSHTQSVCPLRTDLSMMKNREGF